MVATDGAPPASSLTAPSRAARLALALERRADRPWFLPAVSIFPLSDYVLPFLPNQMLLLGLSVLLPRRWWQFALAFVAATGLGAFMTAVAIQQFGQPLIDALFGGGPGDGAAGAVMGQVQRYGVLALVGLGMLPWPPRTAVVVCAIAGLQPVAIGAAVAAGRIVPAAAYTLLGAKAPHLLRRVNSIDRFLREIGWSRAKLDRRWRPVEPE